MKKVDFGRVKDHSPTCLKPVQKRTFFPHFGKRTVVNGKSLGVDYYYAHPYHSWERGANENMNGLIRQHLPKGTPFDCLNDNDVKRIRDKLNHRPRKKLGYLTPVEYFFANFATNLNLSLTQKVTFAT